MDKPYTTSVDVTCGPVHNSYIKDMDGHSKTVSGRHFCPLDEGVLSQSNLVTMEGGPLVGAIQSAVLTWQGFPLIAGDATKVRTPRRLAMAVAGYRACAVCTATGMKRSRRRSHPRCRPQQQLAPDVHASARAAVGIPNKAVDIRLTEAAERHIILSRPAQADHGPGTQRAALVR